MPSWNEVLAELSGPDVIRRRYLKKLSEHTGRNVIAYYSGWLQKSGFAERNAAALFGIDDNDKNAFMGAIYGLDRTKGLDLILHTPGGEIAATESIVDYLHKMFGDIRAIVPQIAMSAGSMIALSCRSIVMGKHSNLGPIDPQVGGVPAHGVIEEFEKAKREIRADPSCIPLWQMILSRYTPTLIGQCEKAITWSSTLVQDWIERGMLKGNSDAKKIAQSIVQDLTQLQHSHARHVAAEHVAKLGVVVERLEADQQLQDTVLTVHHAFMHTLSATPACKIVENQNGIATVVQAQLGTK